MSPTTPPPRHADDGEEHTAPRSRQEWTRRSLRSDRGGLGRALGLTALSALLPGAGLLPTRRRVLGFVLVGLALVTVAVLAAYVWDNGLTSTALATAADPERLRTVMGVLVAGAVVWIGSVALTALVTRPRRPSVGQQVGLGFFTALLCLAISAPAVLGVNYISSHLTAMDQVFTDEAEVGEDPSGARPTSALSEDPEDPWADLPRVNLLLLGSDAAEAREGTRTDTMIVASIDTHTGESVLFSIPRNLQRVPIPRANPLYALYPDGYDCGDQCLMNAIWTEAEAAAEEHPEWYADDPTPGLTATREVLSTVLGLPIHHTVIVNLDGFADLIDAMGGITVTVREEIPINGRTYTDAAGKLQLDPTSPDLVWLQPGVQQLDGNQALGYSRSRVTTDDFDRMRRQRCVVAAVVEQARPTTLLQRYPQIISAVGRNVLVDIPQSDLPVWAELVLLVQQAEMRSLPFTADNTDVFDPDYSDIRYRVWEALHPAPEPAETAPATSSPTPEPAAPTTEGTPGTDTPTPDDAEVTTDAPDTLENVEDVCG
ncbi:MULTISPECIES: LCP family protein [unclassified Ornithinimicrobium]|uniref:LCP family protein n=1 Tax=unclassified Ornithinimicrobium TaxID=2615080 RepID=UPI0038539F68